MPTTNVFVKKKVLKGMERLKKESYRDNEEKDLLE